MAGRRCRSPVPVAGALKGGAGRGRQPGSVGALRPWPLRLVMRPGKARVG